MESTTLKPCPFCGNEQLIISIIRLHDQTYCVECRPNCVLSMRFTDRIQQGQTKQQAIQKWNNRMVFITTHQQYKILPCPFCGKIGQKSRILNQYMAIRCPDHTCRGNFVNYAAFKHCTNDHQLERVWNKRK